MVETAKHAVRVASMLVPVIYLVWSVFYVVEHWNDEEDELHVLKASASWLGVLLLAAAILTGAVIGIYVLITWGWHG